MTLREGDGALGRQFFRKLSDAELTAWRPSTPRGMFGWGGYPDCANVGRANREMRRRSAREGFGSVYDWLRALSEEGE